jgi:hypothetical protein
VKRRLWHMALQLISGRPLSVEEATEGEHGIVAFMEYFGELMAVRRQRPEGGSIHEHRRLTLPPSPTNYGVLRKYARHWKRWLLLVCGIE